MIKKEIRKLYLAKRKALSMAEMHGRIAQMISNFENINLPEFKTLLSYKPIEAKNEINSYFFEEVLMQTNPDLGLCYPQANFEIGSMQAFADDEILEWENTTFGLEQPASGTKISAHEIDLIFVPLIALDERGYRVGYGKGFYDRYLAKCRPDAITIGFSFFDPLPGIDDVNQWDVPLKYGVTPQRMYEF